MGDGFMSEGGPGGENPFEGLPMFRDLARLFAGQGPVNWDIARQIAVWTATEGEAEPNVDPVERIHLEELLRVADLHVSNATGLSTSLSGGLLSAAPTTRSDWALRTLQAWRPFLERLATAVSAAGESEGTGPDPATQLLGDLGRVVGPVLLGMQSGYMVGHLGRRALGQYDLPLPRGTSDQLLIVPANITAFAGEWSIPDDDLRLWILLEELTHHAVLGRPHVRARLEALVDDYVGKFEVDANALEGSFADIDPTDPASFAKALSPETLLGIMQTPAQREVAVRIETLLAALAGYVDHILDTVGHGLVGRPRAHRRGPPPPAGGVLRGHPVRGAPARPAAGVGPVREGRRLRQRGGGAGGRGRPGPAVALGEGAAHARRAGGPRPLAGPHRPLGRGPAGPPASPRLQLLAVFGAT